MTQNPALNRIADDIYQLQIPLPFALNIVNVYLLRGQEGWTIVDTGLNTSAARATWHDAFAELQMTPGDIEQIVLTHMHPDHFGLAGWLHNLAQEAGRDVPVYLSPAEARQARLVWTVNGTLDLRDWLLASGLSPEMAAEVQSSTDDTRAKTHPHPPQLIEHQPGHPFRLGDRHFQTFHAPGHSDGQMLFYDPDDQLILSGDQVLMKITPNIGLWPQSSPDPLGSFLDSLRELRNLDVKLALPGHKRLIEDWRGRIDELLLHHDMRLNYVLDAIKDGSRTPYQVAQVIFPTDRFSVHEWRFAIAETLAHLEYLHRREQIVETDAERHYALV